MRRLSLSFLAFAATLVLPCAASASAPECELVINVDNQVMILVQEGKEVAKYPISTSKFGVGDELHSYKTPTGVLEVCDKTGDNKPLGTVFKGGRPTGEVLAPNTPGRDPIVTRIIQLRGLEDQNRHARSRGIWIHGTNEESRIGKPVSWGCIRMRSKDVAELYNAVPVGTRVVIQGKNPSGFHWFHFWS